MSFVMSAVPTKAAVFTGAAPPRAVPFAPSAPPRFRLFRSPAICRAHGHLRFAVARPAPVVQAKRGIQVVTAGGGGPVVADTVPEDVRFDMSEGGQKKRWSMVFALFCAFVLCNLDKVNMSVAIVHGRELRLDLRREGSSPPSSGVTPSPRFLAAGSPPSTVASSCSSPA